VVLEAMGVDPGGMLEAAEAAAADGDGVIFLIFIDVTRAHSTAMHLPRSSQGGDAPEVSPVNPPR